MVSRTWPEYCSAADVAAFDSPRQATGRVVSAIGRAGRRWPLLSVGMVLAGSLGLAIFLAAPLRSAIELGGDEHYELTKAWLWSNGYPLYDRIWSDQPPLFTVLLGTLFKFVGPSLAAARLAAACFGLSLLAASFLVVKKRCGKAAAWITVTCLLVAPHTLVACVSVMQEVPAIGTALWSLWFLQRWQEKHRWEWLAAGGVMLAVAVQIKLTAAILAPALVCEILLASLVSGKSAARTVFRNLTVWAGSALAVSVGVSVFLGASYESIWRLHFLHGVTDSGAAQNFAFSFRQLADHPEALWGACLALVVIIMRRDWRRMAFPLVLTVTVVGVFHVHRPWWSYYYPHLALPLAWLTGYAIVELLRVPRTEARKEFVRHRLWVAGNLLAAAVLVSLIVNDGSRRIFYAVEWIRRIPPVKGALVDSMRKYGDRTRWVYTQSTAYPFSAGLIVIPELSVISYKRFWSGQITEQEILEVVKRFHPEQILLGEDALSPAWEEFIRRNYILVEESAGHCLYVTTSLAGLAGNEGRR